MEELKKLALAATPGPWAVTPWANESMLVETQLRCEGDLPVPIINKDGFAIDGAWFGIKPDDARYLVAANPVVVLDLIATIESLKEQVATKDRRIADLTNAETATNRMQRQADIERAVRLAIDRLLTVYESVDASVAAVLAQMQADQKVTG